MPRPKKPSVEALFHAWLLTLPDIHYVGHTHAPAVNGILCSPRAREFATKRIVPDEVVCCDVESVFVPTRSGTAVGEGDPHAHGIIYEKISAATTGVVAGKPRHHLTGQNRRGCAVRDADGRKDCRHLVGRGGSRRAGFFITEASGAHCGTTR